MKPPPRFQVPNSSQQEQLGAIAAQTFNFPASMFPVFVERVGAENLRVLTDRDQVIAGMSAYDLEQWFGGQRIPMAGIALVCVAPEHRRSGLSQQMMRCSLQELRAQRIPLATLYASTQQPYRRVGFEQAGNCCLYELDMTQLGRATVSRELRPVTPLEAQPFAAAADRRGQITNGNLRRSEGVWQRLFRPREDQSPTYGYLIEGTNRTEGYIVYQQSGPDMHQPGCLHVRDMTADSREAAESLWAFIGSHRSIFKTVQWYDGLNAPLLTLTAECRPKILHTERWMLRIVDVERALSARGYGNRNQCLDLELKDSLLPENEGRYRLTVEGGRARIERGGNGDLKLDVTGLAPLFSGFLTASCLASVGWLSGPPETLAAADALFAGPEPWMPDRF